MERALKAFALVAAFLATAGSAAAMSSPPPSAAAPVVRQRTPDYYGDFYGRWEGHFIPAPGQVFVPDRNKVTEGELSQISPRDMAFSISPYETHVFLKEDNDWQEVKFGTFKFSSGATNAVLFSITADLGTPKDPGGWVETWNFAITHKERDSLEVVFTRVVSNFGQASDYVSPDGRVWGRFFQILYGEMTKVPENGK